MKTLLVTLVIIFLSIKLTAQIDHLPNSYKKPYDSLFPLLHYSYEDSTQTHNYSGNWDIDGDKKPDSLSFIGNGGTHLYFHLRLSLSTEKTTRDFHWLVSDFPMLDSISHFKKTYGQYQTYPIFFVHDFNDDGKMDIYLNTDTRFAPIPSKWKRRGVTSRSIIVSYQNKDIVIKNFPGIEGIE